MTMTHVALLLGVFYCLTLCARDVVFRVRTAQHEAQIRMAFHLGKAHGWTLYWFSQQEPGDSGLETDFDPAEAAYVRERMTRWSCEVVFQRGVVKGWHEAATWDLVEGAQEFLKEEAA